MARLRFLTVFATHVVRTDGASISPAQLEECIARARSLIGDLLFPVREPRDTRDPEWSVAIEFDSTTAPGTFVAQLETCPLRVGPAEKGKGADPAGAVTDLIHRAHQINLPWRKSATSTRPQALTVTTDAAGEAVVTVVDRVAEFPERIPAPPPPPIPRDTEERRVAASKEAVPRSTEAALELFDCGSMGVQSMRGAACAQRHRLAVSRPRTICGGDVCAACPAGAARLRLLEQFLPPPAMPYRTRRLEHRRAEDVAAAAGVRVPLALVPPAPRGKSSAEVDMPKPTYEDRIAARKEAATAPRVPTAAPAPAPPPPPPPSPAEAPADAAGAAPSASTKARWLPHGVPASERIPVGRCLKCGAPRRYVYRSTPEALRPWCGTCRGNIRYDLRLALGTEPTDDQVVRVLSGDAKVAEFLAHEPRPAQEVDDVEAAFVHEEPRPAPEAAQEVDDTAPAVFHEEPRPAPEAAQEVDDTAPALVHEEPGPAPEAAQEVDDVEAADDPEDDDCGGGAAAPVTAAHLLRCEYVVPAELARLQIRPGEAIPFGVVASRIQAAQARLILTEDPVYLARGPLDFDQVVEEVG